MANLLSLPQNRMDIYQLGTWVFFFIKRRYQAFLLQGQGEEKANIPVRIC